MCNKVYSNEENCCILIMIESYNYEQFLICSTLYVLYFFLDVFLHSYWRVLLWIIHKYT